MERKLLDMMNQLFISEYNPRMEYCDKFKLNKIAARWPAKAVAQLSFSQ